MLPTKNTVAKPKTASVRAAPVPAASASETDGIFTGKTFIIAEDIDINSEIIIALLEHTGAAFVRARDGIEALAAYTAAPDSVDLILMDINMPNMDGYEATRRIRGSGLSGAGNIPVVALTANVYREDVEACIACGMNGHLGKPADAAAIIACLREHLK